MSVTSVIEIDLEGMRDYYTSLSDGTVGKRTFQIVTNDPTDGEAVAIAGLAASVYAVAPFSLWPGTTSVYCVKIAPKRGHKDRTTWTVTADYKSILNIIDLQRATEEDPTARPATSSGQSRTIMVPVRRCLRSNFYTNWNESTLGNTFSLRQAANSASDPLDPPIEVPVTEWEFSFTKNVATLPTWITDRSLGYANGVNDADQTITVGGVTGTLPKGCAKLSNVGFGETQQENGIEFIPIHWNVTLKDPRPLASGESSAPGPWDVERLDEGMRTLSGGSSSSTSGAGIWTNIRDSSGRQTISLPVPFNGSGLPLAPSTDLSSSSGIVSSPIPEASLVWACYRPYGARVNFGAIPWI